MTLEDAAMLGKPPKKPEASGGTHPSPLSVLDVFGLDSPGPSPLQYSPKAAVDCTGPRTVAPVTDTRLPQSSHSTGQRWSPPTRHRSKPRTEGLRPSFSRSSSLNDKKVVAGSGGGGELLPSYDGVSCNTAACMLRPASPPLRTPPVLCS